jgi:thiol:disulfide interchange protein
MASIADRERVEQIGAPVRIVALVGLLGALAMGGWVMTAGMRGGSSPTEAATPTPLLSGVAQANAVAGKLTAHNKATAAGKPDAAATAKPKTAAAAKPKTVAPKAKPAINAVKPAPASVAAAKTPAPKVPAGTPHTIAGLLATHSVVVVLLYNPRAKVDDFSLGEAALGASMAKAGFLRVDVLNQRQAEPFLKAYGVLQDPTILFFTRPGKLVHKLYGFADHETVSQAAANAALGLGVSS